MSPEASAILCLYNAIAYMHHALQPTGRDEAIDAQLSLAWTELQKCAEGSKSLPQSPSLPPVTPEVP